MSSRQTIEKDSESKPDTSQVLSWVARLIALLVVLIFCLTATMLLIFFWQNSQLNAVMGSDTGQSGLNPFERVYLRTYLASRASDLSRPIGSGIEPVGFVVAPGQSADEISANLVKAGLLEDAELFLNYVHYTGLDSRLEAGDYKLSPNITVPELARTLLRALPQEIELRFIEGWRIEEMVNYLAVTQPADIDPQAFLAISEGREAIDLNSYEFLSSLPDDATLEGFLFPDTYRVPLDADAETLVTMMLENFDQRVTPALRQAFGVQGLTVYEAVALASIVQREAVVADERPLMVGVFLNRMNQGMPLQADPTVQYALGYQEDSNTWWKSPLGRSDMQIDSPYNTYLHDGLPPGPIANPGLAALEAVASPEQTDYLFFVVDCTAEIPGSHIFSTTFEEHLGHVERCR